MAATGPAPGQRPAGSRPPPATPPGRSPPMTIEQPHPGRGPKHHNRQADINGRSGSPSADSAEQLTALAALFGVDGLPDLDEVVAPLHWPSLPAVECRTRWD